MPGPFDFAGGIAHYSGVGKFDNLNGIDVRSALLSAIERQPASISFINDASAFLVGEWLAGSARGAETCAGLTLGTGVGSAFLDNGKVIDTGQDVPPDGEVHLINYHGRPLEDWVSRRAIIRSFAAAREDKQDLDVRDIIDLARSGDPVASKVVDDAFVLLGEIVGPWLNRFGAEVLVIGGSISKSWDLIESPLNKGLSGSVPAVRVAADLENAPLVGAAYPAVIRGRSTLVD